MDDIGGRWSPIPKPDGTFDYRGWDFHIKTKDKFREVIDNDPEATGNLLELLKDITFERKLARTTEEKEIPKLNEQFFVKLLEDYNSRYSSYKPPMVVRLIKDKVLDFFVALYRLDSAYYERIGGIMTFIVVNYTKFNDINKDYSEELEIIRVWWEENDNRKRTSRWINWIFRFLINKYKTEEFYRKSINHALYWIHLNARNWAVDERFYPEKWYGNGRGKLQDQIYGEA